MMELKVSADAGEEVYHPHHTTHAHTHAGGAAPATPPRGVGANSRGPLGTPRARAVGGGYGGRYASSVAAGSAAAGDGGSSSGMGREASSARMLSESAPMSARVDSEVLRELQDLATGKHPAKSA